MATVAATVGGDNRVRLWAGRILTGLPVAFLVFDSVIKLVSHPEAIRGTQALGYPLSTVALLGAIELACLVVYLIPRTAVVGAVLLTGYLGGAIASHVRLEHPLFSHVLFPVYVATMVWGGLYLRDARLRATLR